MNIYWSVICEFWPHFLSCAYTAKSITHTWKVVRDPSKMKNHMPISHPLIKSVLKFKDKITKEFIQGPKVHWKDESSSQRWVPMMDGLDPFFSPLRYPRREWEREKTNLCDSRPSTLSITDTKYTSSMHHSHVTLWSLDEQNESSLPNAKFLFPQLGEKRKLPCEWKPQFYFNYNILRTKSLPSPNILALNSFL